MSTQWVTYATDKSAFLALMGSDPNDIEVEALVGTEWAAVKAPNEEVLRTHPIGKLRLRSGPPRFKLLQSSTGLLLVSRGAGDGRCQVSTAMSEAAMAEMLHHSRWNELYQRWLTVSQLRWRLNGTPQSVSLQTVASEATKCG